MSGTIIYLKDGFSVKLKDQYAGDGSTIPVTVFEDDNLGVAVFDREHLAGIFSALIEAGVLTPSDRGPECHDVGKVEDGRQLVRYSFVTGEALAVVWRCQACGRDEDIGRLGNPGPCGPCQLAANDAAMHAEPHGRCPECGRESQRHAGQAMEAHGRADQPWDPSAGGAPYCKGSGERSRLPSETELVQRNMERLGRVFASAGIDLGQPLVLDKDGNPSLPPPEVKK